MSLAIDFRVGNEYETILSITTPIFIATKTIIRNSIGIDKIVRDRERAREKENHSNKRNGYFFRSAID